MAPDLSIPAKSERVLEGAAYSRLANPMGATVKMWPATDDTLKCLTTPDFADHLFHATRASALVHGQGTLHVWVSEIAEQAARGGKRLLLCSSEDW